MTAGFGAVMSCSDEGKVHTRVLRLSEAPPPLARTPPAVVITADDSDGGQDAPKGLSNGALGYREQEAENCPSSPENPSANPSEQQLHPGDAMLDLSPPVPVTTRRPCLSEHRRRLILGLFLGCLVALAWSGGAHLLRALHLDYVHSAAFNARIANRSSRWAADPVPLYDAPFFTTWLCTALNLLFFPVYLTSRFCAPASEKTSLKKEVTESVHPLGERGAAQLLFRCVLFATLWTVSTYMFVHSLSLLDATDVVALYTTNVAFVYLGSWVLLQEQFVGIRIVAMIMCNTGIALFAYMDGSQSRSATLGGVVLAAAAAAGTAVYKVLFKKVVGAVTLGQLSFFLTLVGLASILLSWPFFLALYFAGFETLEWQNMPWLPLMGASLFILLANMLGNFGVMWTYEVFLTLGFMFAIPTSLVVDVYMYSVVFRGMKLAGVVLTMIGFCLVLLPNNWPDYITRILRWRRNKCPQPPQSQQSSQQDCRTSYTSRLRTHSGRVK